jgi:hypothetical protein
MAGQLGVVTKACLATAGVGQLQQVLRTGRRMSQSLQALACAGAAFYALLDQLGE